MSIKDILEKARLKMATRPEWARSAYAQQELDRLHKEIQPNSPKASSSLSFPDIKEIEKNTAYEGNNWPNDTVKFLLGEIKSLRTKLDIQIAAANDAVELAALAEWMLTALNKEPVSDFAESFAPVQQIIDMHFRIDYLESEVARYDKEAQR